MRANQTPTVKLQTTTHHGSFSAEVFDAVFTVETREPLQFVDLTDYLNACLAQYHIETGQVVVFSMHTTAAIKINEAEELLLEDFKCLLHRLCPPDGFYHHNDMSRRKPPIAPDEHANGHSHCMHLLMPTSETIPVSSGKLELGTWQRVFLVELDGPRLRQVKARFVGYKIVNDSREIQIRANGHVPRSTCDGLVNDNSGRGKS